MFKTYKGIFDKRAESYHTAMMNCPSARKQEFLNIIDLADIKDGDIVCDIPAGGCYLGCFVRKNIRMISVETSAEFIKYGKDSPSHRKVLCENIGNIPLESNSIDKIVSVAGLHHLIAKDSFYREAYRLLKPGGIFSVADVRKDSPAARFLNIFVHENNSMGHTGNFIDCDTKEELELAGFRVDYAKPVNFFWRFSSLEEMSDYYKLLFGIDLANRDQVFEGIKNYIGFEKENGNYCANWELFYFKAVKL
jgi:SAM-dependent methyltransferase